MLLYLGLGALLVEAGIGIGFSLMFPHMVADGWAQQSGLSVMQLVMAVSLLRILLAPLGLGLLIAAALAGRRTPDPAAHTGWGAWAPPSACPEPAIGADGTGATGGEAGGGERGSGAPEAADFPPLPGPAGHPR